MELKSHERSSHGGHSHHVRLPGSERTALPSAQKIGPADPNERMSVTLLLRRSSPDTELTRVIEEMGSRPLHQRRHLSHEEFAATYNVNPDDLKKVEEFAHDYGLDVNQVNSAAGTVTLSGLAASFSKAFGVDLANYEHPEFTYRGRTGHVHIPENLADIVQAVLGLDNRPQSGAKFRIFDKKEGFVRAMETGVSYTPPEVAQLYNFPSNVNCSDQCIGIIELGGGYRPDDLKEYFTRIGIPQPNISDVSVDGANNAPTGDSGGPDGEVALDIEVAAAVAQGARIAVYFAPNTDAGFLNAITTAIHDTRNKPSVISISWGGPENAWTPQAIQAMNRAFQDAAALGITVCCASGDNGSSDGVNDGRVHVDFPASSPYVLACGGTRLEGSGRTIEREFAWNEGMNGGATGGGVSDVFNLPSWQENAHVPPSANPGGRIGRGIPDVAGNADPATGYQVLVDGQQLSIGGTSAVAPLWAGLIAIINQKLGHSVGFVNPVLYSLPTQVFHDITSGNNDMNGDNGPYETQSGWDACTGLGSPDGTKLMDAITQVGIVKTVQDTQE
ncbi:protease pro-enzyme activation domain-containing protein [Alicyclobacillus pomorum]|uniref:S53 family peptidase n=1 Tax=Alicyclobacillus pomorum TaxID=204470 RepID=UPI00040E9DDF|nr:S53 family peptidase [Alicyclobacillus pomorum]